MIKRQTICIFTIAISLVLLSSMTTVGLSDTNVISKKDYDDSLNPCSTPSRFVNSFNYKTYEDENGNVIGKSRDKGYSIMQTSDGGYIIAGETRTPGLYNVQKLVWLIKTDINGEKEWDKTYGLGLPGASAHCVRQTYDGGYILVGHQDDYPEGNGGVLLIKTDGNGNKQWQKLFRDGRRAHSVMQTPDGYIVAGISYSEGNSGDANVLLLKTDQNGNKQWVKKIGNPNTFEGATSVRLSNDGGYIIAGQAGINEENGYDFLLIKTDESGNKKWLKTFDNNGWSERGTTGIQTSDGGYAVAGFTTARESADSRTWLVKTDPDGNEKWNKISDTSDCWAGWDGSLIQTNDRGYMISGLKGGDACLFKLDNAGNQQWINSYSNEELGIENTDTCGVYTLVFSTAQTLDGGYVSLATNGLGANSAGDIIIIKTDHLGNFNGPEPENNPPIVPILSCDSKSGYSFTVSSCDPDDDELYYRFDWGDGTDSGWLGPYSSCEEVNVDNVWYDSGTFKVFVEVKDSEGLNSFSENIEVNIVNAPPVSPNTPIGISQGFIGNSYDFVTEIADLNNNQVSYGWDWNGDDVVDEWSSLVSTNDVSSFSHTWNSIGVYNVKVKAKNEYGLSSDWSEVCSVTITELPVLDYSTKNIDLSGYIKDNSIVASFEIWNSGGGTLEYTLTEEIDWIEISSSGGKSTGEYDTIYLTFDYSGLSDGLNTGDIKISSNGGFGIIHIEADIENSEMYILDVNIDGRGHIYLNPPGGIYEKGTEVKIAVVPEEGWSFEHWSADDIDEDYDLTKIVTMDKDQFFTAHFKEDTPPLFIGKVKSLMEKFSILDLFPNLFRLKLFNKA